MQSDQGILSLLVRFLYIVLWKGHFEQWTDISLPCLNLCHRIHFQSNIIIYIIQSFVKTKMVQFVSDTGFLQEFYNYLDLTAFQHVF